MMIMVHLLTALLPIVILVCGVIFITISIAWNRNHFLHFFISLLVLFFSFLSLFFIQNNIPIDINFLVRIDNYSIFYSALILFFSFCTCFFSYSNLINYRNNKDEFYLLVLLSTIGCILLTMTVHMASLFIGLELVSLPLIGLIGYFKNQKKSLESTLKYMILSSLSSTFLLFGISLVYIGSGGLSFIELQQSLNFSISNDTILLFGIGMILISFFFKLSLFPFHLWMPDVYEGSSALVLIYFSTAVKISIFIALVRFFLYLPVSKILILYFLCSVVACCSILFGNIMSLFQNNFKRLLAYSSIAHFGYLLIALLTCNFYPFFLKTTGIFLLGYCFSNLGIFSILNYISNLNKLSDIDRISSYQGLFWKYPLFSFLTTSMIFSLAGIPISLGFIGKLFLFTSIITEKLWLLGFVMILGTSISLYYYLRMSVIFYFPKNKDFKTYFLKKNIITFSNFLIFIIGLINIFFGFFPNLLIEIFDKFLPLL